MRIIIGRKEAPGVAANNPRREQQSGACTPECSPHLHSTCAPSERQRDTVDMRELKGMELAARARIVFINGHWVVPSQTSPTTSYKVNLEPVATCECDDWQLRKQDCKHVIAARIVMARDGSEPAPEIDTTTVPKRPTYQQADWSVYKMAQRQEKPRFLELLADLVSGVEEPARQGCGRKPVPI